MAPATSSPICPQCTEPGTLKCVGCNDIQYCSVECQHADWPSHKLLCKDLKDFKNRPAENMRRVVYFPVDGTKPEFMWLPIIEVCGDQMTVDVSSLMEKSYPRREFQNNEITGVKHERFVHLVYDDNAQKPPNASMRAATGGILKHDYRTPVVAVCGWQRPDDDEEKKWFEGQLGEIGDFDMTAYAVLIAYLMGPEDGVMLPESNALPMLSLGAPMRVCVEKDMPKRGYFLRSGPKVQGVRVNHEGGSRTIPSMREVRIPRTHPIFADGQRVTSDTSIRIDKPILFRKYAASKKNATGAQDTPYTNNHVTSMLVNCDRASAMFGRTPVEWQAGNAPDVLVALYDHTDFPADPLKIFALFCHDHLQDYFKWYHVAVAKFPSAIEACKDFVLDQITFAKFETYLLASAFSDPEANLTELDPDVLAHGLHNMSLGEKANIKHRLWNAQMQPRHPSTLR